MSLLLRDCSKVTEVPLKDWDKIFQTSRLIVSIRTSPDFGCQYYQYGRGSVGSGFCLIFVDISQFFIFAVESPTLSANYTPTISDRY